MENVMEKWLRNVSRRIGTKVGYFPNFKAVKAETGKALAGLAGSFMAAGIRLPGGSRPLALAITAATVTGRPGIFTLIGSLAGYIVWYQPDIRWCGATAMVWVMGYIFRELECSKSKAWAAASASLAAGITGLISLFVPENRQSWFYPLFEAMAAGLMAGAARGAMTELYPVSRMRELTQRVRQTAAAVTQVLQSMSGALAPENRDSTSLAGVMDRTANRVCRKCRRRDFCWGQACQDTHRAFNDASLSFMSRGKAEAEDFPVWFLLRCAEAERLVAVLNEELWALCYRLKCESRLARQQELMSQQCRELSELLSASVEPYEIKFGRQRYTPRIFSSGRCRPGETENGDMVYWFRREPGMLYLILSDGRGTGSQARRESLWAVKTIEGLLKAGATPESAARTLDSAYSIRGEGGGFATVDLLAIDLYTGQGCLIKWGAAPTYIKREDGVERLGEPGPPPGTGGDCESISIELEEGDMLVMASDGLADRDEDGWLLEALSRYRGRSPRELAPKLTAAAGENRDDMTAVALTLCESRKARFY